MARQRKLSPERKEFINSLIEHYKPEDAQDVTTLQKILTITSGCFVWGFGLFLRVKIRKAILELEK